MEILYPRPFNSDRFARDPDPHDIIVGVGHSGRDKSPQPAQGTREHRDLSTTNHPLFNSTSLRLLIQLCYQTQALNRDRAQSFQNLSHRTPDPDPDHHQDMKKHRIR